MKMTEESARRADARSLREVAEVPWTLRRGKSKPFSRCRPHPLHLVGIYAQRLKTKRLDLPSCSQSSTEQLNSAPFRKYLQLARDAGVS